MTTLDERIAAAEAELARLKKEEAERRKFVPDIFYAQQIFYGVIGSLKPAVLIPLETKQQSEAYAEWLRLHKMLADFAGRDEWKPDWSDKDQAKWSLKWNYKENSPDTSDSYAEPDGVNGIYFASFNDQDAALALLGDRAKFYLTFTIQGA